MSQMPMLRGQRESGEGRKRYQALDSSSSSSCVDGYSHCQETNRTQDQKLEHREGNMTCYRSQLEKEVQMLEKQLQEEIELHVTLAKAVGNNFSPLPVSRTKLSTQELLASIVSMEKMVAKLEEELSSLHFRLQHEREEHDATESHLKHMPISSLESPSSASRYMREEQVTSSLVSKLDRQPPPSLHLDVLQGHKNSEPFLASEGDRQSNEVLRPSSGGEGKKLDFSLRPPIVKFKRQKMTKHCQLPNKLSEEMVLCMKTIFLCLSGSSTLTSKASLSECIYSPSSSAGYLSLSSFLSSDSLKLPSIVQKTLELNHSCVFMVQENLYDPYGVNEKLKWSDIGKYCSAIEVSWMSVGKVQLNYAAVALKEFRFLIDQLAEVNPAKMSSDERLAFWINLYNALMMHAYLAYGVPKSEIKLFSLMKKASYTVGGQSFSAVDIEFIILKMKPPPHRPQIALVLALHKFKISEEHKKYSIDCSEPLARFALSCGMYSCPAVRIFTAKAVKDELQQSMKDYIQASVGVDRKGMLLIPKLLYCFAKGTVGDSSLVDWICGYLTQEKAALVRNTTWKKKKRLPGARSFSIVPFNSRFRYLFLPCNNSHKRIA